MLRTKSMSEILPMLSELAFSGAVLARLEPVRNALSVPMRRRGKSSVPRRAMVDFRPLLPPAEPEVRKRVLPKSRLKSSQIMRMSEVGIL